MSDLPIARCPANEVEAWGFPFYATMERGIEPVFLYLEDHVLNFDAAEKEEISDRLVRFSCENDLAAAGFSRGDDGIWLIA